MTSAPKLTRPLSFLERQQSDLQQRHHRRRMLANGAESVVHKPAPAIPTGPFVRTSRAVPVSVRDLTHLSDIAGEAADRETWTSWRTPALRQRRLDKGMSSAFFTHLEQVPQAGHDRSAPITAYVDACRRVMVPVRPIVINDQGADLCARAMELIDGHAVAVRCALEASGATSVDLADNCIGPVGTEVLLSAPQLRKVVLSGNRLGRHGAVVCAQFLVLHQRCQLMQLDIAGNAVGAYGAQLVVDAMLTNRTLTSLNVARNAVGDDGARHIGRLLNDAMSTLRNLDISGNGITEDGFAYVATGLERNRRLCTLIASGNSLMKTGVLLASVLERHPAMRRVDIGNCDVGVDSGMVLTRALRLNPRIEEIVLNGNPLGTSARAIVWCLVTTSAASRVQRHLHLSNCTTVEEDADDPFLFDPRSPGGPRVLDMASPFHQAVATEVLAMATLPGITSLTNVSIGMRDAPGVLDVRRPDPWATLPARGVVQFDFMWYPRPTQLADALSDSEFGSVMRLLSDPLLVTDIDRLRLFESSCSSLTYRDTQIRDVLSLFTPGSPERIVAAAHLLISSVRTSPGDPLASLFAPNDRVLVDRATHLFSRTNPTGHYRLNLSSAVDRHIAQVLVDVSGWHALQSRNGAPGLSQSCNGHLWRNETLDGAPFVFAPPMRLPPRGILDLDFVLRSTDVSAAASVPALAHDFVDLLQTLNGYLDDEDGGVVQEVQHRVVDWVDFEPVSIPAISNVERALGALRRLCSTDLLLAEQAAVVLRCFRTMPGRVDAFVCMYGRIIGDQAVRHLFQSMFDASSQITLMSRLGPLALWSPFVPVPSYSVELRHADARLLVGHILRMVLVERRLQVRNAVLDGRPINIPAVWIAQMPDRGTLRFDLAVAEPNLAVRQRIARSVLGWDPGVIQAAIDAMGSTTLHSHV
ncbi:Leucine-rich repeat-containing protein [Plasmodiophora brassicae]|uniref:Uncharacterized protein n=1 Tax=Plasmodiophora brassicae TaxID=37360 RepID=A0A0G4J855_PLABS|nr:hypothetical protein PBRA_003347 [Plasmodiophora brassicae]